MSDRSLWEILVPTVRRSNGRQYRTRYHRVWDARVRSIAGGLTVLTPVKGQWLAASGDLHMERVIPVRIACSEDQILEIMRLTREYYDQLDVMAYRVSNRVIFLSDTE